MFESNSRCARGQGLNMKVPGCGVSQRRTGFQWEHSLLGGGGRAPCLVFFPTIALVRGLVLVVSSDDANVKALPVPHSQLSVIASGWKTSGHVIFRLRSQIWPHLLRKVLKIFFLTWLVSLCITGLIKATSKRNSNRIKPRRVNGLTDSAWVCSGLSTPCQLLSTNRDITGYMWESITSIQECLWEIELISQKKKTANTIIASVSEA